jgi:uncharacterized protein YndB with AHSA1/START domain
MAQRVHRSQLAPARPAALPLMAIGALAAGAVAFGAMAIGRLAINNARIRSLAIDRLKVRQLQISELTRADGKHRSDSKPVGKPVARTGMLIRRPAGDVFEALVDPATTSKFWFSRGSGRLQPGKVVQWYWDMYGVSAEVTAKVVEPNKRIVIEWPGYSGPTEVEWTLASQSDGTTFVGVTETGFTGDADQLLKYVADSTQGFTLMLAGLKGLLEHDVKLNLTADRYPDATDCRHRSKTA